MPRTWIAALLLALSALPAAAQEKVVKVYNWSDYIDESMIADFTKETGIEVVYDVYDSNEILETKLLAGQSGYDLVVPTGYFLARQLQAGIFQKFDRSKLSNWGNLDRDLLERSAKYDPGNEHAFIYMWGTTGVGYNLDKIKERMPDAPLDSLRMVFDPEIAKNFADCGIYMLDSPTDVLPAALTYLGLDPDSKEAAVIEQGMQALAKVRPYVRKFHSSENINALANGDICLSLMWSGDAGIAKTRAEEAGNGVNIAYAIPKEGAMLWFDMMAMPADAPNPENAYAFMNYLLRPEVIAKATNYITYPNGNAASLPFVDEALRSDPNVYPAPEVMQKLYVVTPYDARVQRTVTRLWTSVVSGQ